MNTTTREQAAAITELELLTDEHRDVRVEAWAMPEESRDTCSIDWTHGTGRCYLNGDPLCVACVEYCIRQDAVIGSTYSIDVTR